MVIGWLDPGQLSGCGPRIEVDQSARPATHGDERVGAGAVLEVLADANGDTVFGAAHAAGDVGEGEPAGRGRGGVIAGGIIAGGVVACGVNASGGITERSDGGGDVEESAGDGRVPDEGVRLRRCSNRSGCTAMGDRRRCPASEVSFATRAPNAAESGTSAIAYRGVMGLWTLRVQTSYECHRCGLVCISRDMPAERF